ncbi:MAG: hypothetical protein ABIS20_18580, partial [Thermoanaerobaculia bacterium]
APGIRWAATAAVVALSLLALRPHFTALPSESTSERELAAALQAGLQSGDTVVATGLSLAGVEYALRHRRDVSIVAYPSELAAHPGYLGDLAARPDALYRRALEAEATALLDRLAARPDSRALLVFAPSITDAVLFEHLRRDPRLRHSRLLGEYRQARIDAELALFELRF